MSDEGNPDKTSEISSQSIKIRGTLTTCHMYGTGPPDCIRDGRQCDIDLIIKLMMSSFDNGKSSVSLYSTALVKINMETYW